MTSTQSMKNTTSEESQDGSTPNRGDQESMNDEYKWLQKLTNKSLEEAFEGIVDEVILKYKITYK